jgi:hypothetical protein
MHIQASKIFDKLQAQRAETRHRTLVPDIKIPQSVKLTAIVIPNGTFDCIIYLHILLISTQDGTQLLAYWQYFSSSIIQVTLIKWLFDMPC